MQTILERASMAHLLKAERIAIKYNPKLALEIAKIYWHKQSK